MKNHLHDAEEMLGHIFKMFVLIGILSAIDATILLTQGCRSSGGNPWHGDPHLIQVGRNSVDPILSSFKRNYGMELKWDWSKHGATINYGDVPGRATGETRFPNHVTVQNDAVVPHEMVHVILNLTGYPSRGADDHHKQFPKVFNEVGW